MSNQISYEDWWQTHVLNKGSRRVRTVNTAYVEYSISLNVCIIHDRIETLKNPAKIAYYEGLLKFFDKRYEQFKVEELLQCQ